MKTKSLFPIFLIVIGILICMPQIHNAHAGSSIQFKQKATNTGANAVSINVGPLTVATNDALVINVYTIGTGRTYSATDTLTDTFTVQVQSLTANGSGSNTIILTAIAKSSGTDTVTVTASSSQIMMATFLDYSGVAGFGVSNTNQQDSTTATGTSTVSMNGMQAAGVSWVVEAFFFESSGATSSISYGNNQIDRDTITTPNCTIQGAGSCHSSDVLSPSVNFPVSISWTTNSCALSPGCFVSHSALELQGQQVGPATLVTSCYGECGNPAITLTNPNATHSINFNQSYTIFYEFQSNLNGVVLNVTTNVAKTYGNGQQIGLGLWKASCPISVTPFTIQCAGTLQPGALLSNPSVVKGRFSIKTNTPVNVGDWVAIGVTGVYSGLDLNETNGTCGDSTSGTCIPPMMFSHGNIPQVLSTSASCTSATSSPCNFANISTTGLWAWIQGNVVTGAPPPTPSIGCINVDLACFLVSSACGLTPSNCFIGGSFIFAIYFIAFVMSITLMVSYINREYDFQVQIPPSLFFLFFLLELFAFGAMGLIPPAVVITIFIVVGLGVAGYFGSAFLGRSGRKE